MKRGFIFSLLVLIVLTFMLLELNIYVRAQELREQLEPTRVRTAVISEIATKLKKEELAKISTGAAVDALYALTNASITKSFSLAEIPKEIESLMMTGKLRDGTHYIKYEGTLSKWDDEYKRLAERMGIELKTKYENFFINQSTPWTVTVTYTFSYTLYDRYSGTKINASYPIEINVSIINFPDPAITRAIPGVWRNIDKFDGVFVRKITNVTYGRGWFYGKLANRTPITEIKEDRDAWLFDPANKEKIFYTNRDELANTYGNIFGAVLYVGTHPHLVNPSVPFAASKTLPELPAALLIIAPSDTAIDDAGGTVLYDIEGLRDFVICGKYVNNSDAPNFLQRIANRTDAKDKHGIETVLAAQWVPVQWKNYSHIDHEFYNKITGERIMGLPGCLWKEMCALQRWWVNATRLNESHFDVYGVRPLVCRGGRCG